ncbi:MAG: Biotin transporter BioY [Chlamydiae bacterium]|nr:Biotin transporter BioY [Chlamydiota bacterium]
MEFALSQTKARDFLIVVGASILLALSAWISVRIPFTPVPISFTAPLILMLSVLLGKRGAYATALYFLEGALGLPVFANGGCGFAYLLGPTGGYLVGFVIASYVVGCLSEQMQEKTPTKIFGIMLFGNALFYVFGVTHLALLVGYANAIKFGLIPFVGLDLFKLFLANRALKTLRFFG